MSTPKPDLPSPSSVKEIAELAAQATGIEIVRIMAPDDLVGVPKAVPVALKHGQQPSVTNLADFFEPFRMAPQRKAGTAKVETLQSFIDLADRHKTPDSVIFAKTDWQAPSLTAVIDYHENEPAGAAAFGHHRVHYAFPLSQEWQAWIGMNGKKMEQADFAAFIEDHIAELSSPQQAEIVEFEAKFATKIATPAELIQLSRGLQVNVESAVKSNVTLQSGEGQIAWEEVHRDGSGQVLKVPGLFMLQIPLFFMGEPARVPVRLRYRVVGGKTVWFYQIYRPDVFITERVRDDLDQAAKATGLPAFEGEPEMRA